MESIILWGLLIYAAVIDWRTLKIPNILTVPGMIIGLLFNGWVGLEGILLALILAGSLTMFGLWGGGDAKLLMAVGAFVGPSAFYTVFVTVLVFAAMVSLINAWRHKELKAWVQGEKGTARPFPLAPLVLLAVWWVGR